MSTAPIVGGFVHWKGALAEVLQVRGDRVALCAANSMTILTTLKNLEAEIPVELPSDVG